VLALVTFALINKKHGRRANYGGSIAIVDIDDRCACSLSLQVFRVLGLGLRSQGSGRWCRDLRARIRPWERA
jgi:hypothetical protein